MKTIYSKIPIQYINQDKAILIIHQLNLLSNHQNKALFSIKYLIQQIAYKDNDQIRGEIKQILLSLEVDNLITLLTPINRADELIVADVEPLKQSIQFVILQEAEYNSIMTISNKRTQINLLKLLLFLKCKSYKRPSHKPVTLGKANCYIGTYDVISNGTNIPKRTIKNYIETLSRLKLLTCLSMEVATNGKNKTNNIYIVHSLVTNLEAEIKQAKLQQTHFYQNAMHNTNN